MASQVSPGIILKERDLSNVVVVGAQQITAAFAATFVKGPINEITNINSQKELVNIFGKPTDANAEDWYVASEFLSYGGRLAVVRAASGVENATTDGGILVQNEAAWEGGAGSSETFVARTAGTWGNSLLVAVVDKGADQYVTLNQDPADVQQGTILTFTSGKTAEVIYWDSQTNVATVLLTNGSELISTLDTLDDPDTGVVATINSVSGVDVTRTPGTYNGRVATGGTGSGATFNVVVAQGAEILDLTDPQNPISFVPAQYQGGAVSVTVSAGGLGYVAGDTLTVASALIGTTGPDVTFDIASVNDTAIAVTAVSDWYSNTEITYGMGQTTGLKLSAIGPRPGTSEFASSRGIEWDEVHVAVIDLTGAISGSANNIVERFTYLSKLSDGKSSEGANTYYRTVINEQSSYVFTGAHPSTQYNAGGGNAYYDWGLASTELEFGDKFNLALLSSNTLFGGEDDFAYSIAEYGDAMDLFLDTEETEVDFILMGASLSSENDTKAKANKVVSIAATRKDCVAFVSPHKGNQIGASGALTTAQQKINTINFFNGLTSTSYAVFDSGYKYFYDRFNDKYRYLPCNGDVAGLCVSTSATLDDWYSPAGVNRGSLRNAVKLAYNPNKADRDELYQSRINPIVSFPGSGVTLFGDKTALASPSAFDRINVRRLFLNVEKRVGNLAKQVLFEQNDEATRASFASAVGSYLNEVQARRGVTDYLVVCDDSNNTSDVIDRNEFVAEIYIKPTRSINYITITFTATKTGVSFNEVVGR
jgi:hypothetical protein